MVQSKRNPEYLGIEEPRIESTPVVTQDAHYGQWTSISPQEGLTADGDHTHDWGEWDRTEVYHNTYGNYQYVQYDDGVLNYFDGIHQLRFGLLDITTYNNHDDFWGSGQDNWFSYTELARERMVWGATGDNFPGSSGTLDSDLFMQITEEQAFLFGNSDHSGSGQNPEFGVRINFYGTKPSPATGSPGGNLTQYELYIHDWETLNSAASDGWVLELQDASTGECQWVSP